MDSKQIRKSISRLSGWLGLSFCSLIIKCIPRCGLYSFAKAIGALGFAFAHKQRNIALESLRLAFGREKSEAEIQQIAKDCFSFMAKSGLEIMSLLDNRRLLNERIGIVGEKNLDDALSNGKGVILVSAHFGNFPLLLAKLSLQGYKASAIMRQMRDSRVEKIFLKKRQRYQVKTIYSHPRDVCVEKTIKTLRNNEIVFIPIDQNFGTGGVFVDFFGRKAATATGPVVLAQRTKASIIPCFIIRQADDTHKIIFEPPLEIENGATDKETVIINIQKLTGIIESYIRRYPAEWGWIHRRWKSRPSQEGGV